MCGEDVSTYAIDKTSGVIVMAGPSPNEVFFRSYKAPERYGDFPATERDEPEKIDRDAIDRGAFDTSDLGEGHERPW